MVFKQHSIDNRHPKENCRPIILKYSGDGFGGWFLTTENCRLAIQQRKRKCVSKSIGEWQTRRRKQSIAVSQVQDFPAISFVRIEDVRLSMHRAFRFAGAS